MSLPAGMLGNLRHVLDLVEEFGPSLGRPHTAPLRKGLFEIRVRGAEGIARSLFCMLPGREVVILHPFVKKTQKIPQKHLETASRRMKEVTRGD